MPLKLSNLVPFGEWRPDLGYLNNPGATVAKNVLPVGDAYEPYRDLSFISGALGAKCQGYYAFFTDDGNVEAFAGTATNLYRLSGTTWNEVSKTTDAYSTASNRFWQFVNYGDRVVATNFADPIQSFVIGSSSVFADLANSGTDAEKAPRALSVDIINNFVVALNLNDPVDGDKYARVRWSALDDPTDWERSVTTLADQQDFYGATGTGTKVLGFENYGLLVMDNEVWRMQFVGTPEIFLIEKEVDNFGSKYPGSVLKYGKRAFLMNERGFFMYDGRAFQPIGEGKVNRFFFQDVSASDIDRTLAAVDPKNNLVVWAYVSADSPDGNFDKMLVYSLLYDRWSLVEQAAEFVASGLTSGLSIDDIGSIYSSIDDVPYSLDSIVWQGGSSTLIGFDTSHRLGYYDGPVKTSEIETSEARLSEDFTYIDTVLPVIDDAGVEVRLSCRDQQAAAYTGTDYVAVDATTEEASFRKITRYAKVGIRSSAAYTRAQGIRFRAEPAGQR